MKEQRKSEVCCSQCGNLCISLHSALAVPLLRMDQYSWHEFPLCRINSNGEKQPLTASAHTASLTHCMKIDGFDIISKASLSHMPAVKGTGWDQPVASILISALKEKAVFHHWMHLLFCGIFMICLILLTSYTQTLWREAFHFKRSDPHQTGEKVCERAIVLEISAWKSERMKLIMC